MYIVPPEQYSCLAGTTPASFASSMDFGGTGLNCEEEEHGDYATFEEPFLIEDRQDNNEDIISSESFMFPIVPISAPITVVPLHTLLQSSSTSKPPFHRDSTPSIPKASTPSTPTYTPSASSSPPLPYSPSPPPPSIPSTTSRVSTSSSTGIHIRINLRKPTENTEQVSTKPNQTIPMNQRNTQATKTSKKSSKKSHTKVKRGQTEVQPEQATKLLAELMSNSNAMFKTKRIKCNQLYDINTTTKVLVHIDKWEADHNLWVDVNLVRLPPLPSSEPVGKRFFVTGEVVEVQNCISGCDDSGGWYVAVVTQKRENQLKVQYVGFGTDEDWISVDENAFPKKARKYSNSVTGGCILERGDKVEVMWRDKDKEKEFSEPFGWFEATVLDIKDFATDAINKEVQQLKEKQEANLQALEKFVHVPLACEMKCVKCKTHGVGCVLLPCMHLCVCMACSVSITTCPMCKYGVQQVQSV